MNKIRVLLAEDHTIVRKGLRSLIATEADIEVVGEAQDGREAIRKVERLRPDIVLMDISMPRLNGLEATRQIRRRFPDVRVLVLTMYTNEEYVSQLLAAGASGYLVKRSGVADLISALRAVHRGESYLSPSVCVSVIEQFVRQGENTAEKDRYDTLTDREREVFQLIVEGHPNRDIAELLHISVRTVETHKARVTDKLHIHSTAEMVKYAIRRGVISLEE